MATPATRKRRRRTLGAGLVLTGVVVAGLALRMNRARQVEEVDLDPSEQAESVTAAGDISSPTPSPSGSADGPKVGEMASDERALDLINRGNDLLAQGNTEGALAAYLEALTLTPEDEDLHYNLGIAYARAGKPEEAEKHYREALRIFPDYPEVHNNLGNLLVQANRLTEAVEHFNEAIRLLPDYAMGHNNLGTALQKMGNLQEASLRFRKAVELNPRYWEAHFNLAGVYLAQNRLEEGVVALQKVLLLNPDFAPARRALESAQRRMAAPPQ